MIFKMYLFISFATLVMFCLYMYNILNKLSKKHGFDKIVESNNKENKNSVDGLISITKIIIVSFMPILNVIVLLAMVFCGEEVIQDAMAKSEDIIHKTFGE